MINFKKILMHAQSDVRVNGKTVDELTMGKQGEPTGHWLVRT